MGTLNVSFRCVENKQKELEGGLICYANTLYEGMEEIEKSSETSSRTTRQYIIKAIRKMLKKRDLPKKIYNSDIVIQFMWDEYQLAENGSL